MLLFTYGCRRRAMLSSLTTLVIHRTCRTMAWRGHSQSVGTFSTPPHQ